ncbi:MAG: signal peptidase I [Candidatus Binatia bacterium]
MGFNLELALVIGVLLTGGLWLVDVLFLAPGRRERAGRTQSAEGDAARPAVESEPWYIEYAKSFFPVLLIVLVLRSFIAEPFRIPSGSMMPTLLVGDFILVNKFAYGVRLPVLNLEILETGAPERGDVVVFRYPENPSEDYIKRVVGLPGDRIAYFDKTLYINGERMEQTRIGPYRGEGANLAAEDALLLKEELGKANHKILLNPGRENVEGQYVVPPGHYFMMGDNRDNSNDSRYWGPVPEAYLVGEAFLVWMHWNWQENDFEFDRIGQTID